MTEKEDKGKEIQQDSTGEKRSEKQRRRQISREEKGRVRRRMKESKNGRNYNLTLSAGRRTLENTFAREREKQKQVRDKIEQRPKEREGPEWHQTSVRVKNQLRRRSRSGGISKAVRFRKPPQTELVGGLQLSFSQLEKGCDTEDRSDRGEKERQKYK
ncbi:hypothetical protein RUM44_013696 [Polyplax serrata]|uniref:Uncharacterized protein n=1 Tax=Polyplax serrata TaxID=468196 RepID=A0ABR1BJ50_POLSC